MIKRISFLFCSVLMVVMMLAVPAFATEIHDESSIKIIKQPVDFILKKGASTAVFKIGVTGDVESYQWQFYYNGSWVDVTWSDGKTSTLYIMLDRIMDYQLIRCVVTGTNGDVLISNVVSVIHSDTPLTSFIERCIYFVTSWVGTVISSLTSPEGALYPLFPILAIGIAVTAVLLVIKIFKSFSWGL